VFENRLLRRIFGRKRDEVTGEWRKLHNEERNGLYPPDIRAMKSRIMRMGGECSTYGVRREVHTGSWWGNRKEGTTLETQT